MAHGTDGLIACLMEMQFFITMMLKKKEIEDGFLPVVIYILPAIAVKVVDKEVTQPLTVNPIVFLKFAEI